MTDREKLIELIAGTRYGKKNASIVGDNFQCGFIEKIADHLIANGVTVQKWIPASEPPKDPGEYIVKIPAGTEATTLFWDGQEWFDVVGNEVICYNISAWMPMPVPPKEDKTW